MEVGSADDDWGWGEGTIDGEGSGGAWGDALPGAERHLVGAGAPWDDAWGTAVPPAQGASGQESVASAELTRAEMSGAEAAVVRELAAAATQLGDMQGALRLALQGGPIGLQGEAGAVQPVERIVEKVVEVEKIVEVAGAAEVAGKTMRSTPSPAYACCSPYSRRMRLAKWAMPMVGPPACRRSATKLSPGRQHAPALAALSAAAEEPRAPLAAEAARAHDEVSVPVEVLHVERIHL